MLNTSNFWGFKASKRTTQNYIPGTSKWVCNEMNEANKLILQNSKFFSGLVSAELMWLNEAMAEVLESKEDDRGGALLFLKSPAKVSAKNSPVRKLIEDSIAAIGPESAGPIEPIANFLERPAQPVFDPKTIPHTHKRTEEKENIIQQVQKLIPNRNSYPAKDVIPKLQPLKEEITRTQSVAQLEAVTEKAAPTSEESLILSQAEHLSPAIIPENLKSVEAPKEPDDRAIDISFEAISKTITVTKNSELPEHHTKIEHPLVARETRLEPPNLPSTTPVANKVSLASFATLPSKEPLTVKSTKKDSTSFNYTYASGSSSRTENLKEDRSRFQSIYPPLEKLRPLPKNVLEDHKDEDSPFKEYRESAGDWIPPSPKRSTLTAAAKVEEKKSKESPLNGIFANAIKRARDLLSPSKEPKVKNSDNDNDTKSVKKAVSSKNSRGNLMDRLTADTESSAARNLKKLDLQPTSRLYPEIESPLSKRYNKSPSVKRAHTDLNTTKSVPDHIPTSIPKLPAFTSKNKAVSPLPFNKTLQQKRKAAGVSPERIITKAELSNPPGSSISTTTGEIQRKRAKAPESLTQLPLAAKPAASNRVSSGAQLRINRKMAEERAKVEEMRKQRLSNTQKAISIDEQIINPLQRMREKSMKAAEHIPADSSRISRTKEEILPKRKMELETRANPYPVLAQISDEAMNKRRKTEEKNAEPKASRLTGGKVPPSTSVVVTSSSYSAKTQNLMKTATLQHNRANNTSISLSAKHKESVKSTHTTPVNKSLKSFTPKSKSPLVLPEIFSEPEDDDEGHILKDWAESPELKKLLLKQQNINPDVIFGAMAPLQMDEIFRGSRTSKFRARSSSARWGLQDMLSHKEAEDYSRRMGWKK